MAHLLRDLHRELLDAIEEDKCSRVETLLRNPQCVATINWFGNNTAIDEQHTALMSAAFWGHHRIVEMLLKVDGVDAALETESSRDEDGGETWSALDLAVENTQSRCATLIKKHLGLESDAGKDDRETATAAAVAAAVEKDAQLQQTTQRNAQLASMRAYAALAQVPALPPGCQSKTLHWRETISTLPKGSNVAVTHLRGSFCPVTVGHVRCMLEAQSRAVVFC